MASLPWHSYNNFNETAKLGEKANHQILKDRGRAEGYPLGRKMSS